MLNLRKISGAALLAVPLLLVPLKAQSSGKQFNGAHGIQRVLLISIDGMHALNYRNCSKGIPQIRQGEPYCPNLAELGDHATVYPNATTSKPSDSFPGLMAFVSGGRLGLSARTMMSRTTGFWRRRP